MSLTLPSTVSTFGSAAKAKLANPGASGEPEDHLRAPFEQLLADLAELCGLLKAAVSAVGEFSVSDLKTRPDYAVTVHQPLVGFIELKAPRQRRGPAQVQRPARPGGVGEAPFPVESARQKDPDGLDGSVQARTLAGRTANLDPP